MRLDRAGPCQGASSFFRMKISQYFQFKLCVRRCRVPLYERPERTVSRTHEKRQMSSNFFKGHSLKKNYLSQKEQGRGLHARLDRNLVLPTDRRTHVKYYEAQVERMFGKWLGSSSSVFCRVGHSVLFYSVRYTLFRSKKRTFRSFPFFSRVFGDL